MANKNFFSGFTGSAILGFTFLFFLLVFAKVSINGPGEIIPVEEMLSEVNIIDANSDLVQTNITVVKKKPLFFGREETFVSVKPTSGPVSSIVFEGMAEMSALEFGLQDMDDSDYEDSALTNLYAIDPTKVNFTSAQVTVEARGRSLFKCVEYDFEAQECWGRWKKVRGVDMIPGQNYTFTLTPEDPAFGENGEFIDILDKDDYLVESNQTVISNNTNSSVIDVQVDPKDKFEGIIDVFNYYENSSGTGREVILENITIEENLTSRDWEKVFSVDSTFVNATHAEVIANTTAKSLFMCPVWNFTGQYCLGNWVKIANEEGGHFNLTTTPIMAGFATSADHVDILDKSGYLLNSNISVISNTSGLINLAFDVEHENSTIESITVYNLNDSSPLHEIKLDPVIENISKFEVSEFSNIYAINPENMDFDNLSINLSGNHIGKKLYKCTSWDIATQECVVTRTCSNNTDERGNPYCNVTGGWVYAQDLQERTGYSITVDAIDPAFAEYAGDFTAPYCSNGESPCIANSSLLKSRGSLATPEPNQPNTIDSCTDGNSGTYLSDESVENITITSLNNSQFRPGDTVQVDAWVYCYDSSGDNINIVYTNNANSPSWSVKAFTDPCSSTGLNKISHNITLDSVEGNHTVRVINQYNGATTTTCGSGNYDDNDDVVFLVLNESVEPSTQTIFGESGTISTQNFDSQLIEFTQTYSTTPLVFATPVTQNAGTSDDDSALIPLIYSINTTHMNVTICQDNGASTCDTTVSNEELHYFILDPSQTYPDWMEVGTISATTNGANTPVTFSKTFLNNPYVFTQAQTYSQTGSNIAPIAWVDDVTTTGANILGCTHQGTGDACDSSNPSETFGYFAIDVVNANFSSAVNFQSGSNDISSSTWTAITWTSNYSAARMMVTQNDDDGAQDPQYAWARDVDTSTPDIRYCEQDGADYCDSHTSEFVMWFTMEGGAISTGEPSNTIIEVQDENQSTVPSTVEIVAQLGDLANITVTPTNDTKIKLVEIFNHNLSSGANILGLTDITNDSIDLENTWALDPTGIDSQFINVTFTATGNYLHKCVDFNFSTQLCDEDSEYELLFSNLTPGQNYTITLNSSDPGFGESITGPANIIDARFRNGAQSGTNYGTATQLRVGYRNTNDRHRAVIAFNLSSIPEGATITNAQLGLYYYSTQAGDDTSTQLGYSVHRIQQSPNRDWQELEVSWDDYSTGNAWSTGGADFNATPTDTVLLNDSNLSSFIEWNVTVDVANFYANLSENFGWLLKEDTDTNSPRSRKNFYSSNYGGNTSLHPYLIVNYTLPPSPPNVTNLNVDNVIYALNETVLVFAEVTDDIGVDTVQANITQPDTSSSLINLLFNNITSRYEGSYTLTDELGTYSLTIIANDTENSINNSEMTTFKVVQPEVNMTKTDSPDPVLAGNQITYNINYTVEVEDGIVILEFEEINPITFNTFPEDSPTMIETQEGTLLIAYHAQPGTDEDIYVLRSVDKGQNWTEIQADNEADDDSFPNVFEDDDGELYIVYTHSNAVGGLNDVWVINSSDDGLTWSDPYAITNTGAINEFEPSLENDGAGMYYVAYQSAGDLYIINSSDIFGTWSTPIRLTNNSYGDYDIELLFDGDQYLFAWAPVDNTTLNTTQEIFFVNTNDPLVENLLDDQRQQVTNNEIHDYETSLSKDAEGNIYIGWVGMLDFGEEGLANYLRTSNEIFVATSFDNGSNWDIRQITDNNISDSYPGIVQTGTEGLYYLSALRTNGSELDVTFGQRVYSPKDAVNMTITDVIPKNTSLISIGQGGSESGGNITWTLPVVYAGQTGLVSFVVEVNGSVKNGTVINNTAFITYFDVLGRLIDTVNATTNTTVTDDFPPLVENLIPTAGSEFNETDEVLITANVTDNALVDTVLLNLTLPGPSSQIFVMTYNPTTTLYEYNFTNTSSTGNYSYRIIANDSTGNINDTQNSYFLVTNDPPSTPTNITCNGGTCDITVDSPVSVQCSGSIDPNNDTITYFVEAFFNKSRDYDKMFLESDFEVDEDGFIYIDDLYGTSNPTQATGSRVTVADCASGSCLNVKLNENTPTSGVGAYSGGWNSSFTVIDTPENVTVNLDYKLRIDQFSDQTDFIRIYYSNMSGGAAIAGPQRAGDASNLAPDEFLTGTLEYSEMLIAGDYDFNVGCYMSGTDATNENGECWIDNVVITGYNTTIVNYTWEEIGNNSEGGSFSWDVSQVSSQDGVDLRCRALDDGSFSFSDYYYGNFSLFVVNHSITIFTAADNPDPVNPFDTLNLTAGVNSTTVIGPVLVGVDFGNGTIINYTMVQIIGDPQNGTWLNDSLDTYLPAGPYNYTIYAQTQFGKQAVPVTGTLNISTLVTISLDQAPIDFGNTTSGTVNRSADNGTGGNGYEGGLVKGFPLLVNNDGNVNSSIFILGTNLVGTLDSNYQIDVGDVSFSNTSLVATATPLSTSSAQVLWNLNLLGGQGDIFFWISPTGTLFKQSYSGNVTITASQS